MKRYLFALVLSFGIFFAALPETVGAAETKILDTTITKYEEAARNWEPAMRVAARRLFLILCAISLVFTFGYAFVQGNMGLGDFFSEFIKFGITMGFFYWLMEEGPSFAAALIDSMTQLGQTASSDYVVKLTPSDICTYGFGLIYDSVAEFGKSDYSTGILVIVIALMIALIFAVIAAQMVVLLCSAWILIYAGVFYLGFGGGRWTTDIAKNYFKTVLAQAMQIFTFCLLIGIGQKEIQNLTVGLRSPKQVVVANYWWFYGLGGDPLKTITSETLTISGMCVCLVFALVLAILVSRVPGLVAGVITGSSISAMAFSGVGASAGSAAGMAMGAVSGGAMMATQAAGGVLALNSAYKQSQESMKAGEGRFEGMSSGGGLAGAMSRGVAFAGDMMSNLASGTKETAKNDIQKGSIGGQVSANIDAERDAAQAKREDDAADGGGDGTDAVAVSGSGAADGDTGGESGGDPDSAAAASGDADAADGNGGSDVAAGDSGFASAMSGGDTGSDPSDVFGGPWDMSGGYGDDPAHSEWMEAIKNYDPSKIGRLDDE